MRVQRLSHWTTREVLQMTFFFPSQKVSDVFLYCVICKWQMWVRKSSRFSCLAFSWDICYSYQALPNHLHFNWIKEGTASKAPLTRKFWQDIWTERHLEISCTSFFGSGKVLTSFVLDAFALPNRFAVKVPTSVEFWEGTNFWIRDLYLAMLFLTHIGKKIYLVKHNHMCKLQEKKR